MNSRIPFVLAGLLALSAHSDSLVAPDAKVDCTKIDEVLDDMGHGQGMTTLSEKYKLSTNEAELKNRCQEFSESIKTLRKYNRDCFTSLTQQVFSAILRTRSQFNEAHCKPDAPEFRNANGASKCIAEAGLEAVKEAEKKSIRSFQVLLDANIADEKQRIRRSCCAVIASKKVFIDAAKEKCPMYESTYNAYIDSYTNEALSLICPEISTLECDKVEQLKTDGVEMKYKFFLTPIVKLVKTLDH